ncbi:hypothetical protein QBC35DRAFT_482536 [Podospora australis]|uniref:FAD/NAD(P)-binding domain-containing protein n=1 Tax=Podospora australis TaxID=1536484 RepID=A0AAN6X2Z8_9PEZI|nr:hypothetical protein QBC35DRAFT_482536 [Podospora australis]
MGHGSPLFRRYGSEGIPRHGRKPGDLFVNQMSSWYEPSGIKTLACLARYSAVLSRFPSSLASRIKSPPRRHCRPSLLPLLEHEPLVGISFKSEVVQLTMVKTMVILGAGPGGIPAAHYLLKHTAPRVAGGIKVVIVAPNTHLFWCFAAVRAILPDMLADDKVFVPIAPAFAKYPSEQYEIVLGKAEKVDPGSNTVQVTGNDGSSRAIPYDELIVATGSTFKEDMPFKTIANTDTTKQALHTWQQRIKNAKSIVIAGGGFTGVEVAGELGQEYASTGLKEITLIVSDDLPFDPKYAASVREAAKRTLEGLKVKVITNAKVQNSSSSSSSTAITLLSRGKTSTLEADLFLPTYGIKPNTSFLPDSMLDERGFVNQTKYLQAQGHDNIWVVGDAGNLQDPTGKNTDEQVVHLVKILEARLVENSKDLPEYKPDPKIMMGVSIGRNKGTGQMGGWKVWSLLIWFAKGRYLGTNHAQDFVAGTRTMTVQKNWGQ